MRVLASLLLLLAACGGEPAEKHDEVDEKVEQPAPAPETQPAPVEPEVWKLPEDAHPAMLDPSQATETAPDKYRVKLETTKGDIVVEVHREWAPKGADRFYNLVKIGFFEDIRFFRTIKGFMTQFGISGYPDVMNAWRDARIEDDTVTQSNTRGRLTFATAGPNTRTTQLFINYKNNAMLDGQGFSPIGEVVEGMEIVDSLYGEYGEGAPRGKGPNQAILNRRGNAYLESDFPKLDYIKKATIIE